jgi:hypothetical protein
MESSEAMTAAQRKAAERARHKEAGRVAVTHYIYPQDREKLALYVQWLTAQSTVQHGPACHGSAGSAPS